MGYHVAVSLSRSASAQSQSGECARALGGGLVDISNCSSNSLARSSSVTSADNTQPFGAMRR
jgi:hypothetical protein